MKSIKRFEAFFGTDIGKPTFDFDQTLHVVDKDDVTNTWICLDCDLSWENFNRMDPEKCVECNSINIEEIENSIKPNDFRDIYNLKGTYENLDPDSHQEVIDEIKSLIESTIDKSGGEFKTFIESLVKDPEKFKIEGLINDSDIYDFYLKYRNSIDEVLNDIKFYDEIPSELNCFGLYDYTIMGTLRSVQEFVKMIK
jgi:hypothetical protein